MRKQYIYKDILTNDLIFVNNVGDEFILTEAVSPLGDGTYDIIVAFPKSEEEDGIFNMERDPRWWCGASEIDDFLKGKSNNLLDNCRDYCNVLTLKKENDIEVFYTGGGIWIAACKSENNFYYVTDNDNPFVLTCYDHEDEDTDEEYPCQNMVWSAEYRDLLPAQKIILDALRKSLEEQMS